MRRIDIESLPPQGGDNAAAEVTERSGVTTVTIIVVDRKESLVIEK